MSPAARAADACFGNDARALNPRSLGCGSRQPLRRLRERVLVVYRPAALVHPERDRLRALSPRARELDSARLLRDDEDMLDCERSELASIAGGAAACLLAAHDNGQASVRPPRIMGIVNVTPDSFSDGGRYLEPDAAVDHALALQFKGADLLDVGGESTRPGAREVPEDEELARVLPVIRRLAERARVPISIDTTKAAVARAALDAGARMVNDVSAGRFDPGMLPLVAERGCEFVAMHMQGTPRTMQLDPQYGDPMADVLAFLRERVAVCLDHGIALERIAIDPGIGFGKRPEHNIHLLRRLEELRSLGLPICLGVSRKSFLAELGGAPADDDASGERLMPTAAAVVLGVAHGAEILRVHDVKHMGAAARAAYALHHAAPEPTTPPQPSR